MDDHLSYDNLLIVLAIAAAVPFVLGPFPGLPLPGPVLEIVAGIALGTAALNVVHVDAVVQAFSTIGLGFLLSLAGLEIDIQHFRGAACQMGQRGFGEHACAGGNRR